MSMNNTVVVIGNVTRDPELRFLPSGTAVVNFGIAENRTWTDRSSNERKEATHFFDVTAFDTLAENVAESLGKGARVVVVGALEQRSWETNDGEKRSKVEIKADEISPSLRWASVAVTKNEKRGGGGAGGDRPPLSAYDQPAAAAPATSYDYDEEPF